MKITENLSDGTITIHGVSEGDDEDGNITIPGQIELCYECGGKGTHVHRGVDAGGLTSEDFAGDPEFAEDYFSGRYDVSCDACNGSGRCVTFRDPEWYSGDHLAAILEYQDWVEEDLMIREAHEAERRAGA